VAAGRVHGQVEFRAGDLEVVPHGGVAGVQKLSDMRRSLGPEGAHGLQHAVVTGESLGISTPRGATTAGVAAPQATKTAFAPYTVPEASWTPVARSSLTSTEAFPALRTSSPPSLWNSAIRKSTRSGRLTQRSPGCEAELVVGRGPFAGGIQPGQGTAGGLARQAAFGQQHHRSAFPEQVNGGGNAKDSAADDGDTLG
jgi:hypothetical protein